MTKRIAIIGGGIAGLTAAWQLARLAHDGAPVEAHLFESSDRLGGIVETVHDGGFLVETGPDAWVTEKPWARTLAHDLGLADDLLFSNDAARKTHILANGTLQTMPDGMRMMVPSDLDALDRSELFSASAKLAYRSELARADHLKASAPADDESIAGFTRRHFGDEVLTRIAAPLLSGVLGGDVERLSVQAVMPQFVAMEREHGSLIKALRIRSSRESPPIFTTLRSGLDALIRGLIAGIPSSWLTLNTPVEALSIAPPGWSVRTRNHTIQPFDAVFLAAPPRIARTLLQPLDPDIADLLHMESSSAILVALGYTAGHRFQLPPGFGFLVPPSSPTPLLACTFVDQKFDGRVPSGARLLRAFFGGPPAEALLRSSDRDLTDLAQKELANILGPLCDLAYPSLSLVRRWPQSLPQYTVGHLTRMADLRTRIAALPGLVLLGNAYRGVGLPDLIRDAREAAIRVASTGTP